MGSRYQRKTTTRVKTGELVEDTIAFTSKVRSIPYVMVFRERLGDWLYQLKGNELKVLLCIAGEAEMNTNQMALGTQKRKDLSSKLHISTDSFKTALSKLKKLQLINGNGSEYKLNPVYFWRGSQMNHRNTLNKSTAMKPDLDF